MTQSHWSPAPGGLPSSGDDTGQGTLFGPLTDVKSADTGRVRLQTQYSITGSTAAGRGNYTFGVDGASSADISVSLSEWADTQSADLESFPTDGTYGSAGETNSTSPSTGSITPSLNNNVLYAGLAYTGADTTITEEGGWTSIHNHGGGSSDMPIATMYKDQATAASESAEWTLGAARGWICHIIALLPATTAGLTRIRRDLFPRPKLRTPGWGQRGGRFGS